MSLCTDIIFVKALRSNDALMEMLAMHDVYNTTIALPDTDLDNAQLPYVIVSFDGLSNDQSTKDDYEGDTDQVTVSIEVAAKTRPELAKIAKMVRATIKRYFSMAREYPNVEIDGMTDEDYDLVPLDYQFNAQAVMFYDAKPCYWQVLGYQCDTNID